MKVLQTMRPLAALALIAACSSATEVRHDDVIALDSCGCGMAR